MDKIVKHIAPIKRHFNTRFQVDTIGYIPNKKEVINTKFKSCNFCFILDGHGTYITDEKTWTIEPPCVITQWPETIQVYGPNTTWTELYFIYDASYNNIFKENSFYDEKKVIWHIKDSTEILKKIRELDILLKDVYEDGVVDKIDLLCESMIMESIIDKIQAPLSKNEVIIRRIKSYITKHFLNKHNFDQLALENGLSPSSFRRYWNKYIKTTPAKYIMELKIREAARLLVETHMPIAEIAYKLKFDDPLYFSRKFPQITGLTATEYRLRNQTKMFFDSP